MLQTVILPSIERFLMTSPLYSIIFPMPPPVADTGEVWRKFGVISQPAFAVVNSKGNVATHMGHLNLEGIFSLIEKANSIS